MHLNDYDFDLPPEQIAQYPAPCRDGSRLMVLDRGHGSIRTGKFTDIVELFRPGDLLVVNDTRVIPARLLGHKESGGQVEVLLVRRLVPEREEWSCLTRCSKSPRPGQRLVFPGGIEGEVQTGGEPPFRRIRFFSRGDFLADLEASGRIPLPPYLRREDEPADRERYQTVFASVPGAVAAPTAGLHFTSGIFESLKNKGVEIQPVTLHVGLGTFLPVRVAEIRDHRMHAEDFFVPSRTAERVNLARQEGRRIIALGTTTARTLETAVQADGSLKTGPGSSELFIFPGFRFRLTDALVTNFHLPRSTLLMLVAAFAGRDFVLEAYRRAQREGFRFFSYGDCMLIV